VISPIELESDCDDVTTEATSSQSWTNDFEEAWNRKKIRPSEVLFLLFDEFFSNLILPDGDVSVVVTTSRALGRMVARGRMRRARGHNIANSPGIRVLAKTNACSVHFPPQGLKSTITIIPSIVYANELFLCQNALLSLIQRFPINHEIFLIANRTTILKHIISKQINLSISFMYGLAVHYAVFLNTFFVWKEGVCDFLIRLLRNHQTRVIVLYGEPPKLLPVTRARDGRWRTVSGHFLTDRIDIIVDCIIEC
jgi:hypothetical protein